MSWVDKLFDMTLHDKDVPADIFYVLAIVCMQGSALLVQTDTSLFLV
jgi:hypothetical protein